VILFIKSLRRVRAVTCGGDATVGHRFTAYSSFRRPRPRFALSETQFGNILSTNIRALLFLACTELDKKYVIRVAPTAVSICGLPGSVCRL